jgi:hypothetical protein
MIDIITEYNYKQIIKINQHHFTNILDIVKQSNEPLEGNYFYKHVTNELDPDLTNKQRNLFSIAKLGGNILDIGFNAGHSALLFLLAHPDSILYCFDTCEHKYTKKCFEYLTKQFPNRLSLHEGESMVTVGGFRRKNIYFDIIHIDGSHEYAKNNLDFFNSRIMTHNNAIIVWNGLHKLGILDLWEGYKKDKLIKEFHLIPTNTGVCEHKLGRIYKPYAVCTLTLGEEYKKITKYGRKTKVLYCEKQDYDFYEDEDTYDTTRPPAWSKINLIRKYLSNHEYIVWIDADTHIMNQSRKLQDIIKDYMGDKDIMVSRDDKMINTGVVFIKNTEWSKKFLDLIYNQTQFVKHSNWEQTAFIYLLQNNIMDSQKHVHVLPLNQQNVINSYWYTYKFHDCFIIHFPGCWRNNVDKALSIAMMDFCPIQTDDDSIQSYNQRIHWLEHQCEEYNRQKLLHWNANI